MTYKEFLIELRKTPRDWRLASDGWEIRRGPYSGRNQCPISALANKSAEHWLFTADDLALSRKLAKKIVRAADGDLNDKTRDDLLDACGLKEQADG